MSLYRFVGGSVCDIHDPPMKLDHFGQSVELTDDLAKIIALGGGVIIPAARFDTLGVTEVELKAYKFPGQRVNAPKEFQNKVLEAWSEYHEFRRDLEDPEGALGHDPLGGSPHPDAPVTEEVTTNA